MTHETPSRVNVANILTAVVTHGNSLDDALDAMRAATPASEAAFIQECVYGVLRRIFQLKWRLKSLLKTPLRARDAVIEMLLLAGLYELDAMQTPPYADDSSGPPRGVPQRRCLLDAARRAKSH